MSKTNNRARYTTQLGRAAHSARPGRESLSKRLGKTAGRILARDHHACVYCGRTARTSGAHLHLDHITPKSVGGLDDPTNLVAACRGCNSSRHDLPLTTWCRSIGISTTTIRRQARRALPVSL